MEIAPPFPAYPWLPEYKLESLSSLILPEEDVMEIAPPFPKYPEPEDKPELSSVILPKEDVMEIAPPFPKYNELLPEYKPE